VVDEKALVAALTAGHVGAAALDVFEVEPLAADSELRSLPNVFINPHVAGYTQECQARVVEIVKANVLRVLAGEPPFNVVNSGLPVRPPR
jgi:D-3-phosphoglycerate dehydrogenase